MTSPSKTAASIDWPAVRKRLAEAIEATEQASSPPSSGIVRQMVKHRVRSLAASERNGRPELELLSFDLSGATYAIETRYVCEVAVVRTLSPVPRTPGHLLGVHDHRGQLLPLFDLRPFLGLPVVDRPARMHTVICGEGSAEFGIYADETGSIERLPPQAATALDAWGEEPSFAWLRGCVAGHMKIIDGAALLKDPRFFLV